MKDYPTVLGQSLPLKNLICTCVHAHTHTHTHTHTLTHFVGMKESSVRFLCQFTTLGFNLHQEAWIFFLHWTS